MATNYYQVMNDKYKMPNEKSSPQEWDTFMMAEMTPVKQDDINKLKRVIDLYDKKIQDNKKKRGKDYKLTNGDRQLATMRCEAVYHLAHMEIRKERQKKVKEIMDKLDWGAITDDLNAMMKRK
tara:strand:+ start:1013 stop:1381 length:369 start_codon:yes stop_codon:yes gene_type:complete